MAVITFPRPPSIQKGPTLGSKVYKYYLLWAFWSPRVWLSEIQQQPGSRKVNLLLGMNRTQPLL